MVEILVICQQLGGGGEVIWRVVNRGYIAFDVRRFFGKVSDGRNEEKRRGCKEKRAGVGTGRRREREGAKEDEE
jgi:hypothetical protein